LDKRLLSSDPLTGIEEWFHYDHMTDSVHIETVQNVEPILDGNKGLQNDDQYSKDGIKNEMWHYASIPLVIQMKWLNEYGMDNWPLRPGNEKLLFRLLNSPEWRYLKCTAKIHTGSG
jgi:hypothetical protein